MKLSTTISLYLMVVLYFAAGINHFIHPAFYIKIMPAWIPLHKELVVITGIAEILLALLLLFNFTRRFAAFCLILFLIAVFPANIQAAINAITSGVSWKIWIAIIRLPMQAALIWWAYVFIKRIK